MSRLRWWPLLLAATPLLAHKFHVSMTQVDWNPQTQALEVVLQLFTDDLEAAVSGFKGKRVELLPENEGAIFEYLQTVLLFEDAAGSTLAMSWVGMEMDVHRAWLYLEVPHAQGPEGLTVNQRVFFELFNDQVNTVNTGLGARKATLVFQRDSGKTPLFDPKLP